MRAHYAKVKYTLQPIDPAAHWEGVLQKDSMWCHAEQGSYKMRLREVYKEHQRFKSQAKKLNKWVRANFTAEQQYKKVCDLVLKYFPGIDEEFQVEDWLESLNIEEHE